MPSSVQIASTSTTQLPMRIDMEAINKRHEKAIKEYRRLAKLSAKKAKKCKTTFGGLQKL